jgi:NADH dehydrogenase [ubiquinone] 1 alpha subcomplex assembly factor 7
MHERLDHFMARANAAYYATHDPFADFTTAPEISQVFGELLGLWAAVTWRSLGEPAPVSFVEMGPGRGTLMADALRAIDRAAPDFRAASSIHLIETSARLRAAQRERIGDAIWHDGLDSVPDDPMILLANEFLDALPIRQFVRHGSGWTERFVGPSGFIEEPAAFDPELETVEGLPARSRSDLLSPARSPFGFPRAGFASAKAGDVVERREPAEAIAASIAARLTRDKGAALFLDYGPEISSAGDSLQAIAGGQPADPLGPVGAADLTAHVDFAQFGAAAKGAQVHGPIPQGLFLARLGLFQRTNRLARGLPPREAAAMMDGARRLAEPDRMGRLFKAIALVSPDIATPPGFETG